MNETPAQTTAATGIRPEHDSDARPTWIVCAALALALLVLGGRIAAIC